MPDCCGNFGRRTEQMGAARNVGKGLIDGNPLNEGRKIINYLDGRVAQPLVFLEMAGNKNELRAELARSSAWHTPADPAGPGFVGSGEDNSATDGDGAAAQGWIEQLLDRSIERIQVCMKDRGCRFQLFFVHHSGKLTKDPQGAEPGQIASEYSGATDPVAYYGRQPSPARPLLDGLPQQSRNDIDCVRATTERAVIELGWNLDESFKGNSRKQDLFDLAAITVWVFGGVRSETGKAGLQYAIRVITRYRAGLISDRELLGELAKLDNLYRTIEAMTLPVVPSRGAA
jgi:hypothetical protein